MLYIKVVHPDI